MEVRTMKRLLLIFSAIVSFCYAEKVFVIDVEGMTCEMCPIAVKKSISKVKGVKWVVTSLKNRVAVVVAEDYVKDEDILMSISLAGNYVGRLIEEHKVGR
jgi:mercuric ion binding protein